jgi:hypothetical protein
MHTAQHQVVSTLLGARSHSLMVGAVVAIFSSYSSRQIGTGTVIRVLQRWVEVQSSSWAMPVRFRTCAPLRGHRITGGLAEHMNEWIEIPSASHGDAL